MAADVIEGARLTTDNWITHFCGPLGQDLSTGLRQDRRIVEVLSDHVTTTRSVGAENLSRARDAWTLHHRLVGAFLVAVRGQVFIDSVCWAVKFGSHDIVEFSLE